MSVLCAAALTNRPANTVVAFAEEAFQSYKRITYTVTLHDAMNHVLATTDYRLLAAHTLPDNSTSFAMAESKDASFIFSLQLNRRGAHRLALYAVSADEALDRVFETEILYEGGIPVSFFVYGNGTLFPQKVGDTLYDGRLFVRGGVGERGASDG